MTQEQPWVTELVEGKAIKVGERELIPMVKVRSILRRWVTFGTEASRGSGGGLVWLQPQAVLVRQPDGSEQHIPIPDKTLAAIQGMLAAILALPILYLLIASLMFVWQRNH